MYSTNQETGTCMPLLMDYTRPEKIQEVENDEPVVYDQRLQIAVIHPFVMRIVGTKSLKQTKIPTNPGHNRFDKKNEIDDQKNV